MGKSFVQSNKERYKSRLGCLLWDWTWCKVYLYNRFVVVLCHSHFFTIPHISARSQIMILIFWKTKYLAMVTTMTEYGGKKKRMKCEEAPIMFPQWRCSGPHDSLRRVPRLMPFLSSLYLDNSIIPNFRWNLNFCNNTKLSLLDQFCHNKNFPSLKPDNFAVTCLGKLSPVVSSPLPPHFGLCKCTEELN